MISHQAFSCHAGGGREDRVDREETEDRDRVGEGVQKGAPPGEATMLPCSTSPAVAPVAAATAAAAAVTEAGEVICLLPTVQVQYPIRQEERAGLQGGRGWGGG